MTQNRTWLAVRTTGQFRAGHMYTKEQLGVLGRMAIHGGFLVEVTQAPQSPAEPRKRAGRGRTKEAAADGEQGRTE